MPTASQILTSLKQAIEEKSISVAPSADGFRHVPIEGHYVEIRACQCGPDDFVYDISVGHDQAKVEHYTMASQKMAVEHFGKRVSRFPYVLEADALRYRLFVLSSTNCRRDFLKVFDNILLSMLEGSDMHFMEIESYKNMGRMHSISYEELDQAVARAVKTREAAEMLKD